jgi:glycosyltransferase involved in cell wall biosynthesis
MIIKLKEYTTAIGEIIVYNGTPNFEKLESLSKGYGDIWHSSLEQGYKNAFPEVVYQTIAFYTRDFENLSECVSWRINPNQFAARKSVWDALKGFDLDYIGIQMQAIDFGFRAINSGAVPLYVKDLFAVQTKEVIEITPKDRYAFFRKKYKVDHALFMLYRKGFWKISEWKGFFYAQSNFKISKDSVVLPHRILQPLKGNPTVSYIIPTMMRQGYTVKLIEDLANQTYKPSQVVVVDATPANEREENLYDFKDVPFEVIVKWQETKGSCRARNEAIELCTGDYIIFGDDDIRIPPNYIENHIRFLQTYNADACNGLDIRADHEAQNLGDLNAKLAAMGRIQYLCGVAQVFNNANNCVKREYVNKLVGNDVNYDGGYGEDNDFGLSLIKAGVVVLQNPFSANLHLKPATGGYRFWGMQASIMGKKRKTQPWELDRPVKWIRPLPSPTIIYYNLKQYDENILAEYRSKYLAYYLFKGPIWSFPLRLAKLPYRYLQFDKAIFYAKRLIQLGKRTV